MAIECIWKWRCDLCGQLEFTAAGAVLNGWVKIYAEKRPGYPPLVERVVCPACRKKINDDN